MSAQQPEGEAERLARMPSRLANQCATIANRLVTSALEAIDAHRFHFAVLTTLAEFGAASQARLSERTGVDRSYMVPTIRALERKGAVTRRTDPEDQRRNIIAITPSGEARLAEIEQALAQAQDAFLQALTQSERVELVRLMAKIRAAHSGGDPESG